MTMNDEVGFAPIEDHAELAVPQHPVLRWRLPTESGGRGGEMGGCDSDVGFKIIQCPLECRAFSGERTCQSIKVSRMDSVGTLLHPEATAAPSRTGNTYAVTATCL